MTNQKITFSALDSYFLNTGNMKLNVDYLNDQIFMQFDIVYRHNRMPYSKQSILCDIAADKRRKIKSIIWNAFLDFANSAIENEYGNQYRATSEQLKKYLASYGYDYSVLDPAKAEVEKLFDAIRAEQRRTA